MQGKRMTISIISNILSVAVSVGISLLLTPYLLESLGKEAYSFYPLANNFVSYIRIITLALNSMASRFITIEIVKKNEEKAHTYFSSVFFANVILSAALLLVIIPLTVFIDVVLTVPGNIKADVQALFACTFGAMLLNLVFSVFGIATFAKQRMDLRAGRDIAHNVLRAVLLIVLFSCFKPSIVFLGVALVVTALVNGLIQYFFTQKLMPEYKVRWSECDKSAVWELIKSGIWNSINNLGSVLTMSVSVLIANKLLGASDAGDLSIVQTIPHLISSVINAVYGVLLARIANVFAQGNTEATIEQVKQSQKILGGICTVPAVLVIILGTAFFRLWVPGEDAQYLQKLSIITLCPILVHSTMWPVYGLNVTNNKLKIPALTLIGTGVLSIGLMAVLVKTTDLGTFAITVASSVCNSLYYFLFLPVYAARKMKVSGWTFYPHILRSLLFTAVMVVICCPLVIMMEDWLNNWIAFFAACFAGEALGVVVYMFVVCSREDRKQMRLAIKKSLHIK